MQNITIRKIAKELNLSPSTVSRALSDDYQVSKATKKRVLRYAEEIRYTVNKLASGLRNGKTKTIGVVVCSIDNSFISQMINGVYDHCNAIGYQFQIMQSKGSFEDEQSCVRTLVDNRVEGLLISPSFNSTDLTYLKKIQESGFPIVLFDRISDQLVTHKVAIDNFGGALKAAQYLLDQNKKRILVVSCSQEVFLSRERLRGFTDALKNRNVLQNEELIIYCDPTDPNAMEEKLKEIFIENFVTAKKADAIFTTTDSFTIAAIKALTKLNLKVPVAGFCNSDLADIFTGQPTTVYQPAFELGKLGAKQLLSMIKCRKEYFETVYLPTTLIVRNNC